MVVLPVKPALLPDRVTAVKPFLVRAAAPVRWADTTPLRKTRVPVAPMEPVPTESMMLPESVSVPRMMSVGAEPVVPFTSSTPPPAVSAETLRSSIVLVSAPLTLSRKVPALMCKSSPSCASAAFRISVPSLMITSSIRPGWATSRRQVPVPFLFKSAEVPVWVTAAFKTPMPVPVNVRCALPPVIKPL